MNRILSWMPACLVVTAAFMTASTCYADKVWTDPQDKTLPADFKLQGEYLGKSDNGAQFGAQVIALGDGAFQAVLLPGGLPGAGWDGENKILLSGELQDGKVKLEPATGGRQYLAASPEKFSATSKFPPTGQKPYTAELSAGAMLVNTDNGAVVTLKKTERKSSTLGEKPPQGAIVLFDGKSTDQFNGGRADEKTDLLNTDGHDILTNRKFNDYTLHLEFMLPYRPAARGQGRGNSGCYQVDHFELQILDSFGLDGKNNECGGVYQKSDPKVNMCYPPLTWQTYDIDFKNAVTDASGKVTEPASLTVRHNGEVVQDNLKLDGKTGGARGEPLGTPGPIKLQGHGNPLQFRNIWILEK